MSWTDCDSGNKIKVALVVTASELVIINNGLAMLLEHPKQMDEFFCDGCKEQVQGLLERVDQKIKSTGIESEE